MPKCPLKSMPANLQQNVLLATWVGRRPPRPSRAGPACDGVSRGMEPGTLPSSGRPLTTEPKGEGYTNDFNVTAVRPSSSPFRSISY